MSDDYCPHCGAPMDVPLLPPKPYRVKRQRLIQQAVELGLYVVPDPPQDAA